MEVLAMVDRVDLLIAVIGIVVSILGSSTALWMAVSKKADREDLARLETRLDHRMDRLETKMGTLEAKLDSGLNRLEAKLDALILRLVPDQLPRPEN
jgi:hypothetical protein